MKLYIVAPRLPDNSDQTAVDARLRACIDPIATLIASALSADPALFAVRHENEGTEPPIRPDISFDYARAVQICGTDVLRKVLSECGDPFSGKWTLVRSLVTCRAVFYAYDGQAFVCLATDDPPLASPDERLVRVEECSHLLTDSDYMDGLTSA